MENHAWQEAHVCAEKWDLVIEFLGTAVPVSSCQGTVFSLFAVENVMGRPFVALSIAGACSRS